MFLGSLAMNDGITGWVHLNVAQDAVDVEAGEWEDFGELSVLQLIVEEENFPLSRADMAVLIDDVTLMVDHETCFVYIHIIALIILSIQQLDLAIAVSVEDAHYFLDLECLACICVELGHEAAELLELLGVKSFGSVTIK